MNDEMTEPTTTTPRLAKLCRLCASLAWDLGEGAPRPTCMQHDEWHPCESGRDCKADHRPGEDENYLRDLDDASIWIPPGFDKCTACDINDWLRAFTSLTISQEEGLTILDPDRNSLMGVINLSDKQDLFASRAVWRSHCLDLVRMGWEGVKIENPDAHPTITFGFKASSYADTKLMQGDYARIVVKFTRPIKWKTVREDDTWIKSITFQPARGCAVFGDKIFDPEHGPAAMLMSDLMKTGDGSAERARRQAETDRAAEEHRAAMAAEQPKPEAKLEDIEWPS